ncbi:hypothetical protein, unlikely [Trypanosoma brucei gambiense DAL972]|uniref:Uncharacterized protein n=1 Tax=Trypanosoma brucei gambiense (strain MHOM/CI/86/DAL972) TaxID=679716 RepID=C9ZZQ3_TRYB9|nr:hypothetical protein, unlikely [Trypanosoma brucei gambiense DAL972]CBH14902.1 hypothetical protein, unlikely [Trypanosoma brucei gambiense DAL972]|eukprot:XP_011777168.1 hypothetical protein, unlikely [Trypanosoma brucei gambiense DAL972]
MLAIRPMCGVGKFKHPTVSFLLYTHNRFKNWCGRGTSEARQSKDTNKTNNLNNTTFYTTNPKPKPKASATDVELNGSLEQHTNRQRVKIRQNRLTAFCERVHMHP